MVFSSTLFLLYFLPAFLVCYSLTPKKAKNYIILLFSLVFYAWGAPKFIFLLVGSTIIDFYIVQTLHNTVRNKTKKLLLASSIVMNVGLLVYFKYANFFVENVNELLGIAGATPISWTAVLLPIGISFYTFQTLTYSIDVYRGVHKPLQKLTDYLLYIMSFPQMIAGPIVRFNSIADEIINRDENYQTKIHGFVQFCLGLAKKVLIANVMAEQADLLLNQPMAELSTSAVWIGMLAYTFQIYFDFSGYSDMAIGLGRMMGFTFPENFNSPYIAKNISEFWRRWHITLGSWMRDYLYIPLGGNRSGKFRVYLNLWLVFLISGLWHGASWNFIIWGAFHGVFLILDRLFLIKWLDKLGAWPSRLITFLVVIIGWVFFRIESFSEATLAIKKMFDVTQIDTSTSTIPLFKTVVVIATLFAIFNAFTKGKQVENYLYDGTFLANKTASITIIILAVLSLLICVSILSGSNFNPFIYFRF
jgi:alginate O-acetyltransferase complex protein AlgI